MIHPDALYRLARAIAREIVAPDDGETTGPAARETLIDFAGRYDLFDTATLYRVAAGERVEDRPAPAPTVWDISNVPMSVLNIIGAAISWHHHPNNEEAHRALHEAVETRLNEVR